MANEAGKRHVCHVDNPVPSSIGGMMHLFDFNDALVRRRLVGARKSFEEFQMSFMSQPFDASRCISLKHGYVKPEDNVSQVPAFFKEECQKLKIRELLAMDAVQAHRVPSVVARLMGLDMLPSESVTNIQPKTTQAGSTLSRSLSDKQLQKQKQKKDFPSVPKQLQVQRKQFIREPTSPNNLHNLKRNDKEKSDYGRKKLGVKDKINAGEAWKHSQVKQLEEMKRQLALKQVLVQEKLSEAKRLLTGEQSLESNWSTAHKAPSVLEGDLNPKGARSSKNVPCKYVDNKAIPVSKCREEHFPAKFKPVVKKKSSSMFKSHSLEGDPDYAIGISGSEVYARPIESRRCYDFDIFDAGNPGAKSFPQERSVHRKSCSLTEKVSASESDFKGTDWDVIRDKDSGSGNAQRPTRIVVLKPRPHGQSNEDMFKSSGSNFHSHTSEPVIHGSTILDKSVREHRKGMLEDPREIAREIARQVREKVVQELARKSKRSKLGRTVSRSIDTADRILISHSDEFGFNMELTELKADTKGIASFNELEEDYFISRKDERTSSQEKLVAPPEIDETDDKLVVCLRKKPPGNGLNETCDLKFHDSSTPNAADLSSVSSLNNQADIGNFEELIDSKTDCIQLAGKNMLQHTEESMFGLSTTLSSWLPAHGSLQMFENLEKEIECRQTFGDVAIQDKGLLIEHSRESFDLMKTNSQVKSALREEDTDPDSSYYLPKLESDSENFGDASSNKLLNFGHKDRMEDCCTLPPQDDSPLNMHRSKESFADTSSFFSTSSVDLKSPADITTFDENISHDPSCDNFQAVNDKLDTPPQNITHFPEKAVSQPSTYESSVEVSEDEDTSDRSCISTSERSMMREDFLSGSDSSEVSEEPSPISVLVSSFEGSPSHVHLEDVDSNLKELPTHLRLLKCDENALQIDGRKDNADEKGEELDRNIDPPSTGIMCVVVDDDDDADAVQIFLSSKSPDFDTELQMDDVWCPEGKEGDLCYLGNLLIASGFTGGGESYFAKWHSPIHAIDPSLFKILENSCFTAPQNVGSVHTPRKSGSNDIQNNRKSEILFPSTRFDCLHRHLLFDIVDEILLHKLKLQLNYQPWFRPTKLLHMMLPSGRQLLREIWTHICTFYQHDEKAFMARAERCFTSTDECAEIQEEVQKVVFQVEQVVFSELIEEIVISCILIRSS